MISRFLKYSVFSLITLFYLWIGTAGTFTFDFSLHGITQIKQFSSYNILAESFLSKRLDLPVQVPPALTKLSDPYDPEINEIFRVNEGLHDLVFFNHNLYIYFGPTPAVILYLPYEALTQHYLPDGFVVFLFTFGTLIFGGMILGYLKKNYFPHLPEWIYLLGISVMGICNLSPYLLRRPAINEIAVASGSFFLTAGLYYVCLACKEDFKNCKNIIILSLFAGLGAGARLNFILSGTVMLLIILFYIWKNKRLIPSHTRHVFALIIPFVVIVILLLIYNYLRFGSIFDFGLSHQLTVVNQPKIPLFDCSKIIMHGSYYLFRPPLLSPVFPFIYMKNLPDQSARMIGLLVSVPFIVYSIIIFLLGYLFKTNKSQMEVIDFFPKREFKIICSVFLSNFFVVTSYCFVNMRYAADFMTMLIIISMVIWFYTDNSLIIKKKWKYFSRCIGIMACIISIGLCVLFSLTGESFTFKNHRKQFEKVEGLFKPLSNFISKITQEPNPY